jgi:hypothetical protein
LIVFTAEAQEVMLAREMKIAEMVRRCPVVGCGEDFELSIGGVVQPVAVALYQVHLLEHVAEGVFG